MRVLLLAALIAAGSGTAVSATPSATPSKHYEPTWESLDTRPLPQWYDDAKFGIFIHWGVFSVPSFGSEWFWYDWRGGDTDDLFEFTHLHNKCGSSSPSQRSLCVTAAQQKYVDFMKRNYPPNFSYQDFARELTAEFFNAKQWAKIFSKSGAKYLVLTSKHHEGYTLWPSAYSYSWNAKDVGPHRDLVGELAAAVRSDTDLRFGLYHSLYEWFHPLWLADKASNFTTSEFVNKKIMPEMKELVSRYRPEVLWSDGDWEADSTYWRSCEFLSWLYSESPVGQTVVVNDRWGRDAQCKHGDFLNCQDRYLPDVPPAKKWENAMTIDKESWGFRRESVLDDYLSIKELLLQLAKTVSLGGNFLMNVGPTKEGTIPVIFQERLREVGSWLAVNGEAVYATRSWAHSNDSLAESVFYTQSKDKRILYAIVLQWPDGGELHLGSPRLRLKLNSPNVTMLGYGSLKVSAGDTIKIQFPDKTRAPSDLGWALRMTGFTSEVNNTTS